MPTGWPGERGFVGGTVDAFSGLTSLGARLYDPANGRFISVDPLLNLQDPQSLNAYGYANHNPVTFSDPTGQRCEPGGDCYYPGGSPNGGATSGSGFPDPSGGGSGSGGSGKGGSPSVSQTNQTGSASSGSSGGNPLGRIARWAGKHLNPLAAIRNWAAQQTKMYEGFQCPGVYISGADLAMCQGGRALPQLAAAAAEATPLANAESCLERSIASCGLLALEILPVGKAVKAVKAVKALGGLVKATKLTIAAKGGARAGEAVTPIYRGVSQTHHAYDAALRGVAEPGNRLGHADVVFHNLGGTWSSRLVSFTTDRTVAEGFAGKNGVILQTTLEDLAARGITPIRSPDLFDESELLLEGPIARLDVIAR